MTVDSDKGGTSESGLTAKVPDEQREELRVILCSIWPAVITYDTCGCGDSESYRTQRSST